MNGAAALSGFEFAESPRGDTLRWIQALEECLHTETRLLDRLEGILLAQREAATRDEVEEVETHTHGVRRVLRTLDEARRRREGILAEWTGDPAHPIEELTVESVRAAGAELKSAARRIRRQLLLNHTLFEALSRGTDRDAQRLMGGVPAAGGWPGSTESPLPGPGGRLLNRRV